MPNMPRLFRLIEAYRARRIAMLCRSIAADPLEHPDLARMGPAELADLPFDRCRPLC